MPVHVQQVEVGLSARDVRELLQALVPAGVPAQIEDVAIDDGVMRVRVRTEIIPLAVELVARVAAVEPQALTFAVEIANLGLVPAALREAALDLVGRGIQTPGVELRDGRLRIGAAALRGPVPATFRLADAQIGGGLLRLRIEDLEVPPPRTFVDPDIAPAATAPPGTAPAAGPAPGAGTEEGAAVTPGEWEAAGAAPLGPAREVPGPHAGTYRQVRARIQAFLKRELPDWVQPAVPWLLLLPDFIYLLARLVADDRIPRRAKLLAGAALAYVALPLDVLPDILPAVGLLDDAALTLLALEALVAMSPAEVVREHWPGDQDVLEVVRNGLEWAGQYFPKGIMQRLRQWLQQRQEREGG